MNPRANRLRFSAPPRLFITFFTAVIAIALFAPMNFVILTPGKATPLFPSVLKVSEHPSYQSSGQIYLLTIMITNPDTYVPGFYIARCWMRGDCMTFPRSVYYQRDTNNEKEIATSREEMKGSQNIALDAARKEIARRYPDVDLSQLEDENVKVSLKNTGGPSGGLIFSLGIIELLTPGDLLKGRKVAGTGTITADGVVGPIGGVVEKIIGAKKAGASLLLISRENCQELPAKVEGIEVVAVDTLDEAIRYLESGNVGKEALNSGFNSAGIRGCASVGA
jgi:PDZ domain-containing protein